MTSLHPLIDSGLRKGDPNKAGGILHCKCSGSSRVEVSLSSNVAHNHACGCSKCWKPTGATFAVIGVVPREKLSVVSNAAKLNVLDSNAVIQRHACRECGVHLFGRIEQAHAFKGLDFIHVELSDEEDWQEPQFAAFVSSIIEQGFSPDEMADVRTKFHDIGLPTYDCLSPALMDMIAAFSASQSGAMKAK